MFEQSVWRQFVSPIGTRVFFRVAGTSLENVIFGHMEAEIAQRLQIELDLVEARAGTMSAFHHWLHAPSYDNEYRNSWMRWLRTKKKTINEVHFLTQSRMVRMGVLVANIAFPDTRFVVHELEQTYCDARDRFMPPAPMPCVRR